MGINFLEIEMFYFSKPTSSSNMVLTICHHEWNHFQLWLMRILLLCNPLKWSTLIIMYCTQSEYERHYTKLDLVLVDPISFKPAQNVMLGETPFCKLEHHHFRNWIVTCLILRGLNMASVCWACHLFFEPEHHFGNSDLQHVWCWVGWIWYFARLNCKAATS